MVSLGREDRIRPKELAMGIVKGIRVKPADVGDIKLYADYTLVLMDQKNAEKLVQKGTLRIGNNSAKFEFFKQD